MTWQQFKTYLEENVIQTQYDGDISLREEAITTYLGETYRSSEKNDLELAIINLIDSLKETLGENSSNSFSPLTAYHKLPDYQQHQTWEQMIPKNIALGEVKGEEAEVLTGNTYNLLANIFRDWREYLYETSQETEEMTHKNLNWEEFRYWLNDNIFNLESELSEEAIAKYKVSNPDKLESTLNKLIESTRYQDADFYQLPHFCAKGFDLKGEEEPKIKTWNQLFPNRLQTFFGPKDEREIIDTQTFNILEQIYNDFVRYYKLENELHEDTFLTKFMMEAIIHLNFDLIKSKGYDKFLTNWLSEYTKLTEEERENLKEKKSMAENFIRIISEESTNQKEVQPTYWDKVKQNGPTIVWVIGGIILILVAVGILKRKTN